MHCSFFELSQAGKSTKPQGRTHINLDSMMHAPQHTQGPKKKGRSTKKNKLHSMDQKIVRLLSCTFCTVTRSPWQQWWHYWYGLRWTWTTRHVVFRQPKPISSPHVIYQPSKTGWRGIWSPNWQRSFCLPCSGKCGFVRFHSRSQESGILTFPRASAQQMN